MSINTQALRFIDANLIMYSIGSPHPLREPCKIVLEKIRSKEIFAITNTEVLQAFLYRYFSVARDAVRAATIINNGIKDIISTDPHFDLIPEIARIDPHKLR